MWFEEAQVGYVGSAGILCKNKESDKEARDKAKWENLEGMVFEWLQDKDADRHINIKPDKRLW